MGVFDRIKTRPTPIKPAQVEEKETPGTMRLLNTNIKNMVQVCRDLNQDIVIAIVGYEGSGKSTLASHVCSILEPGFDVYDSLIFNFREGGNNYLDFLENHKKDKFKVSWFDEAVSVFFSHENANADTKDAQKLFKINRSMCHFNVLVTPSLWDLVPDIRQRRVKIMLYTWYEMKRINRKNYYFHKYAFFSRDRIARIEYSKKAKAAFRDPKSLFKHVKPNFIETFPGMDGSIKAKYEAMKRRQQDGVIQEMKVGEA